LCAISVTGGLARLLGVTEWGPNGFDA